MIIFRAKQIFLGVMMAIRKFRKKLKPFIWTMTIAFLFSLVFMTYGDLQGLFNGPKSYAFKINGEKADKMDLERNRAGITDSYSKTLGLHINNETAGIIAADEVINKKLTTEMAKKMKVSVSGKEIDEQFDMIQKNFPDKSQFNRMLLAQGFTKESLKDELKDLLLVKKVKEKFNSDAKIDEADIEKYYNENRYTKFPGESLEDAKSKIESLLRGEKAKYNYMIALEKAKAEMKITDVAAEYNDYMPKTAFEQDGFAVKNIDMAHRTVSALYPAKGDGEEAKKIAYDQYESLIKIAKDAILKGAKVEEELPLDMKLEAYKNQLIEILGKDMKFSDAEIKKYFEDNKKKFDKEATAKIKLAGIEIAMTEEDKEATKKRAIELLNAATPENFSDLAKENSKDPGSAKNGGELGWFGKGMMVPTFEDAAFKGEAGKVYPELVESDYGYHILMIHEKEKEEKVKASHILLTTEISKKTKDEKMKEALAIVSKLEKKELTFEDLTEKEKGIINFSREVEGVTEGGYVPGVGYDKTLTKDVFESKTGKIKAVLDNNVIYIFEKISETPAEKANLNNPEVLESIKETLKVQKANEEIEAMIKKSQ